MNYWNTVLPIVFVCGALSVVITDIKNKRPLSSDSVIPSVMVGFFVSFIVSAIAIIAASSMYNWKMENYKYPVASINVQSEYKTVNDSAYFLVFYSGHSVSGREEYYKFMVNRGNGFQTEKRDVYSNTFFINETTSNPYLESYFKVKTYNRLARFIIDEPPQYYHVYDRIYLPANSIKKEYKL